MTQLNLAMEFVELTPAEHIARSQKLAGLLALRDQLIEEHAEQRKEQQAEREQLDRHIRALAAIVRVGREERPIAR
jgi:hypothetical protein